jgi:asparagine synthase (glutamine-hydrolysing)
MSGIVGILNLDGAPVERSLLQQLTNSLKKQGPDGENLWLQESVGLGHTLLQIHQHGELKPQLQPLTLDGEVWITADARIDGQAALIAKLQAALDLPILDLPSELSALKDAALILYSYRAWGEACLQHLLGDFSFILWDQPRQRLLCARDHFGLKPLYFAQVGQTLVLSNTLNCLRLHPQVSSRLNEQAIADFLLLDVNADPQTTFFADIQRLPIAHSLIVDRGQIRQQRYWTLPFPATLRYRHADDYIEHFHALMQTAVADRLPVGPVSIFFSGGLDSTTIAASASAVIQQRSLPVELQLLTLVYDHLIPDQERYYSGLAAEHLGLPIQHLAIDNDHQMFLGSDRPEWQKPEPQHNPVAMIGFRQFQVAANHGRVILVGDGGDEALQTTALFSLLRYQSPREAIGDAFNTWWHHRINPPIGTQFLFRLRQLVHRQPSLLPFPTWIHPDFAQRTQLRQRWEELQQLYFSATTSGYSRAYDYLTTGLWQLGFDYYDAGVTGHPVEVRLPFLDLRLLEYLLALPALPWLVRKHLLRVAMKDKLPEVILQRPKTLLEDGLWSLDKCGGLQLWQCLASMPELAAYVNHDTLWQAVNNLHQTSDTWELMRPLSLGYWLKSLH